MPLVDARIRLFEIYSHFFVASKFICLTVPSKLDAYLDIEAMKSLCLVVPRSFAPEKVESEMLTISKSKTVFSYVN